MSIFVRTTSAGRRGKPFYAVRRPKPTNGVGEMGFNTREEADAQVARWQAEADATGRAALHLVPVKPKGGPTVRDYLETTWWPTQLNLAPVTVLERRKSWDKHVLPIMGSMVLADVTAVDLAKLATAMYGTLATSTVKVKFRETIQPMIRWAMHHGAHPGPDPFFKFDFRKVDEENRAPDYALTAAEVDALVGAVMPRFAAMARLAATTGMRIGELRGLRWNRVNIAEDRVTITITHQLGRREVGHSRADKRPQFGRPKGGKTRVVVAPGWMGPILEEHRAKFPGNYDLVFTSSFGNPIAKQTPVQDWNRAARQLGWDADVMGEQYRGWHQLRHHYASNQIAGGVSLMVIARNMGHASITTVQQYYAHWMPDHQASELALAIATAMRPALRPVQD